MMGKYNQIEDLKSLDLEMYNNLMFIKNYEGNCEDLCLSFIVNGPDSSEYELKPNGSKISVTNENKVEYIYRLADYKLNRGNKPQCSAFFKGFEELIPISWLISFTAGELQKLISGTNEEIDLIDLKSNTKYIACFYHDPTVENFWKYMESFDNNQRKLVLKFATSCPRPPLLGFKNMDPPFTVLKLEISNDNERLPTAQTCMKILKLPAYSSWIVMRQKLLISIESQSSFEFN